MVNLRIGESEVPLSNVRPHFKALLSRIEPPEARAALVAQRCADVRNFLKDHDFPSVSPHTRLTGSYSRSTAVGEIKDVDCLVLVGEEHLARTPNAVLLELGRVLRDYPGSTLETRGQRRSVRLSLIDDDIEMDLVPAVAVDGLTSALRVPDRPQAEWICSHPLGYAERLSAVNAEHGGKVITLIKMVKAWRDAQMGTRRPKSYVLEVMVLHAVESGELLLVDRSWAQIVHDFFSYVTAKYRNLMDSGTESPRIPDPMVAGNVITKGWERSHFETFMRRARNAHATAGRALHANTVEEASSEWSQVFGAAWPSDDEVKEAVRIEAALVRPGVAKVSSTGLVIGAVAPLITSQPTKYHGEA